MRENERQRASKCQLIIKSYVILKKEYKRWGIIKSKHASAGGRRAVEGEPALAREERQRASKCQLINNKRLRNIKKRL